jgi:hypothetical protein
MKNYKEVLIEVCAWLVVVALFFFIIKILNK